MQIFLKWHCQASKKQRKDSIRLRQHFLKHCNDTWKSCESRLFFQHTGTAEKRERLLGEIFLGNAKIILLQNFLSSEAEVFPFVNKLWFFCHITHTSSFLTSLSRHSVHWGSKPPLRNTIPPSFLPSPRLNLQTIQFLGILPPPYWFFVNPP